MFVFRIKQLRTAMGISQEFLSKKSGISQMQISNIERGSTSTTFTTLEKLANALDCCVYDLFYYQCEEFDECDKIEMKKNLNCRKE